MVLYTELRVENHIWTFWVGIPCLFYSILSTSHIKLPASNFNDFCYGDCNIFNSSFLERMYSVRFSTHVICHHFILINHVFVILLISVLFSVKYVVCWVKLYSLIPQDQPLLWDRSSTRSTFLTFPTCWGKCLLRMSYISISLANRWSS